MGMFTGSEHTLSRLMGVLGALAASIEGAAAAAAVRWREWRSACETTRRSAAAGALWRELTTLSLGS
jgi:hypothetical protein